MAGGIAQQPGGLLVGDELPINYASIERFAAEAQPGGGGDYAYTEGGTSNIRFSSLLAGGDPNGVYGWTTALAGAAGFSKIGITQARVWTDTSIYAPYSGIVDPYGGVIKFGYVNSTYFLCRYNTSGTRVYTITTGFDALYTGVLAARNGWSVLFRRNSTNSIDGTLRIRNQSGAQTASIASPHTTSGGAPSTTNVAISTNGTVFFYNSDDDKIYVYSSTGSLIRTLSPSGQHTTYKMGTFILSTDENYAIIGTPYVSEHILVNLQNGVIESRYRSMEGTRLSQTGYARLIQDPVIASNGTMYVVIKDTYTQPSGTTNANTIEKVNVAIYTRYGVLIEVTTVTSGSYLSGMDVVNVRSAVGTSGDGIIAFYYTSTVSGAGFYTQYHSFTRKVNTASNLAQYRIKEI